MQNNKTFFQIIKNEKGFSLIEILVAIALGATVLTLIITNVTDSLNEGEVGSTKIKIGEIEKAMANFKRHCYRYPTTEESLTALIEKPGGLDCKKYAPNGYIDSEEGILDVWESPFLYESDGKTYKITSYGTDRSEGGDKYATDIVVEGR